MNNQEYRDARASIAGVWIGRIASAGFGVYYACQLDLGGVCVAAFLFWVLGFLLPVIPKK